MYWRLWNCNKILPVEFSDDISNYELICKLFKRMSEIYDDVKHAYDELEELIKISQNENLLYIKSEILRLENVINQLELRIYSELYNIKNLIAVGDLSVKNWTLIQLEKLKKELLSSSSYSYVKNPFNNIIQNIQTVINILGYEIRHDVLTCTQFDINNLTCSELDGKDMTAYQYDFQNKKFLWFYYKNKYPNPQDGGWFNFNQIISYLVSLHQNGYTSQEFDNNDLTSEYLDNLDLTAYVWDTSKPE